MMNKNNALETFSPLFEPKTIAVVGASARSFALPNTFMKRIRDLGYKGDIYPIHPSAAEIDGLTAYKSLADTPKPIDYAYIAVAGGLIPAMLETAKGRLRFAHVISSGFGEVDEGRDLQEKLVAAAHAGGLRLIGPNCMGLFSPRGSVTFAEVGQRDVGTVGVISQSGGLGTDIIRRGFARGVKFSGVVTVGTPVASFVRDGLCAAAVGLREGMTPGLVARGLEAADGLHGRVVAGGVPGDVGEGHALAVDRFLVGSGRVGPVELGAELVVDPETRVGI